MPQWLPRILARISRLAAARRVLITDKARREVEQLDMGLDREDVCELLASLNAADFATRVASELTGEWLYVFRPEVAGLILYVKVIVREDCVLVSFHEDESEQD